MEGYIMKRKLILCSLMLCIASSSIQIDTWPSRTSNLVKSLCDPGSLLGIAMHYAIFKSCQSMTYKDRLKQQILFILYANLVAYSSVAIHELGHAVAATSIGDKVNSIKVNMNIKSLISLSPSHSFTSMSRNEHSWENLDKAKRDKDYSTIRASHLKKLFVSSMGPICGLVGTYAMLRTYKGLKLSAEKISPSDKFWKLPILVIGASHLWNLIPSRGSDGAKILLHLTRIFHK